MVPNAQELSALLSPHKVSLFLDEYWGKKPLYIPGRRNKFSHLKFGLKSLETLIRSGTQSGRLQIRFVGSDNTLKPIPRRFSHFSLRRSNITICADWISDVFEPLGCYCAAIKASLNMPGSIFMTCYASADEHGLGTHYDCHASFVLQIEGTKRWRFSKRPAVYWPPASLGNPDVVPEMMERYPWIDVQYPDEVTLGEFEEAELTPGDALYLPPGTWHTTRASGHAVALTMTCIPMTASDIVGDLFRAQLCAMSDWRRDIPPALAPTAPASNLPPNVRHFFESRLLELQQCVRSLRADDIFNLWAHHVHSFDTPFMFRSAGQRPRIKHNDVLCPASDFTFHYVEAPGQKAVTLYYLDNRLDLSYSALPIVKRIIANSPFTAYEAKAWLGKMGTWPAVKQLLEKLVRAGILKKVEYKRSTNFAHRAKKDSSQC
jgi:hypothetical protein